MKLTFLSLRFLLNDSIIHSTAKMEKCEAEIKRLEQLIRSRTSRGDNIRIDEEIGTRPTQRQQAVIWTGWASCPVLTTGYSDMECYINPPRTRRRRRIFFRRKAKTSATFEAHRAYTFEGDGFSSSHL